MPIRPHSSHASIRFVIFGVLVALLAAAQLSGCHCVQGPTARGVGVAVAAISRGPEPILAIGGWTYDPGIGVHGEVFVGPRTSRVLLFETHGGELSLHSWRDAKRYGGAGADDLDRSDWVWSGALVSGGIDDAVLGFQDEVPPPTEPPLLLERLRELTPAPTRARPHYPPEAFLEMAESTTGRWVGGLSLERYRDGSSTPTTTSGYFSFLLDRDDGERIVRVTKVEHPLVSANSGVPEAQTFVADDGRQLIVLEGREYRDGGWRVFTTLTEITPGGVQRELARFEHELVQALPFAERWAYVTASVGGAAARVVVLADASDAGAAGDDGRTFAELPGDLRAPLGTYIGPVGMTGPLLDANGEAPLSVLIRGTAEGALLVWVNTVEEEEPSPGFCSAGTPGEYSIEICTVLLTEPHDGGDQLAQTEESCWATTLGEFEAGGT